MKSKFMLLSYIAKLTTLGVPQPITIALQHCIENVFDKFEASSRSVSMLCHSFKMGAALRIGSKLENAGKLTFDYDPEVEGHYFKVGELPITFTDENGKKCGIRHRPDALRLLTLPTGTPESGLDTTQYLRFAEFKTWEALEKLSKRGDRYTFDPRTGKFRSPPGEAAAREIGCGYDIFTERDLNATIVSNVEYLHAFYHQNVPAVPAAVVAKVKEVVSTEPGISCPALLAAVEGLTMDRFCKLIVDQKIYVPIDSCHLDMPSTVQVFSDRLTSNALLSLVPTKQIDRLLVRHRFPRYEPNEIITIRGKNHVVVIAGAESVQFRTEKGDSTVITRKELERLLKDKQISSLGVPKDSTETAKKILLSTPPERLRAALERLAVIKPVLEGKLRPKDARNRLPNFSTWLRRAKNAVREFGSAVIGLIDGRQRQGHHGSHLSVADEAVISEVIESVYATNRAPKKCAAYARYRRVCTERCRRPVSEKSFHKRIRRYAADWLERQRHGNMAAAAIAAPVDAETLLPGGGRWFLHVGHCDEFTFDLATVFPELGIPLGTAWVAVMIDSYTRTTLAIVATFEAPSYVTTMALLRECVSRWGRLPEILFMDNGPGYKNDSLKLFAEYYGIQLCWRPPGMPRWGSEIERFVGDVNQRVANELPGATKALNRLRRISKSHHPDKLAIFGLQTVSNIVREWGYDVFDKLPHKGLDGKTPEAMRAISQCEHGERTHIKIANDSMFTVYSLPSPSADGTAKVQEKDGVQVDNLYYWNNVFYDSDIVGTRVQVRYDPFDVTKVFAFVQSEWVQCDCLKLRPLRHLSPENLCAASLEIRKSRSDYNKRRNEVLERVEAFLDASVKKGEELAHLLRTKESARQLLGRVSIPRADDDDEAGSAEVTKAPTTPPSIPGFTSNVRV